MADRIVDTTLRSDEGPCGFCSGSVPLLANVFMMAHQSPDGVSDALLSVCPSDTTALSAPMMFAQLASGRHPPRMAGSGIVAMGAGRCAGLGRAATHTLLQSSTYQLQACMRYTSTLRVLQRASAAVGSCTVPSNLGCYEWQLALISDVQLSRSICGQVQLVEAQGNPPWSCFGLDEWCAAFPYAKH